MLSIREASIVISAIIIEEYVQNVFIGVEEITNSRAIRHLKMKTFSKWKHPEYCNEKIKEIWGKFGVDASIEVKYFIYKLGKFRKRHVGR